MVSAIALYWVGLVFEYMSVYRLNFPGFPQSYPANFTAALLVPTPIPGHHSRGHPMILLCTPEAVERAL